MLLAFEGLVLQNCMLLKEKPCLHIEEKPCPHIEEKPCPHIEAALFKLYEMENI